MEVTCPECLHPMGVEKVGDVKVYRCKLCGHKEIR